MEELFDTEMSFADMGLSEPVLRGIEQLGFAHPTAVQARMIPLILRGRDVLGQSKTGTGKTAGFGLPLLEMLDPDTPLACLCLTPTRELAIQVAHELRNLGRFTPLKVIAVYGGQRMRLQAEKLKKDPQIVVGTPGRVMDMHRRGLLPYDNIQVAILDEVDRMLDIGFREDIRQILGAVSHKHQTVFVSATISPEIETLARRYMDDPEKLDVSSSPSLTVSQVTQRYFSVQRWDKNHLLVHLLKHEEPALTLVFCRTKQTVDALTDYLKRKGVDATAIHGDMYQGQRNRVMTKFRKGELSVLVASDLAARGLDVDDISHVINYDLPEDPEIYVHRIGRTARTGREGIAWSFVTPEQGDLLTAIEKLANVEIPISEYADFKPGPPPKEIAAQQQQVAQRQDELQIEHSRIPLAPPPPEEGKDESKFPGGLTPVALPVKRMGGRLRSRRR
ncbi:MAG: DEAD/DEAH box helicase [Phycisphaerales bacterium]|nr:MAG: DEAD/DEAH box helicase [Phycisphaerales bacterium]